MVDKELWKDLPPDDSPMMDFALCYARHGIPVFPIKPKTKTGFYFYPDYAGSPSRKYPDGNPYSWKAQASTDPDRIRRFWTDHPDANICAATGGGLCVIDLDREHVNTDGTGKETLVTDGWERLREWQKETGLTLNTDTVMSLTGRGGNQLFYHTDPNLSMKGSSDIFKDNSGCDSRGENNYVLLPPSIHPNGSRYTWELAPDEYPIIQADEAFFTYWNGASGKATGNRNRKPFDPYQKVTSSRHDYMTRYTGWMIRTYPNLKQSQYEDMLRKKNDEDIFPPLGMNKDDYPDELERTIFPYIQKLMIKDGEQRKEQRRQADQYAELTQNDDYWNSLLQMVPDQTGTESASKDLTKFHKWSMQGKNGQSRALEILDLPIVQDIIRSNDLFLLNGKLYLYEGGYFKEDPDNIIFKDIAKKYIYEDLVTDQRLTRVIKLLKSERSIKVQEDNEHRTEINLYSRSWICFRNCFLDLKTMKTYPHDPKYRNTVQIPHDWNPEHDPSGSITETYLKDFLKTPDDYEMFLEYAGLCMTRDMHFQKMLILKGEGGLGKSVLLRMMDWMIGSENISNITLQNLNDRFSPLCLHGKLLNYYSDLSSEDMQNTSGIKTVTGEDRIRAEVKGGDLIFFYPFCKLLFSANRIPKSRDEKTTAYYRRLLIIPFQERAKHIPDLEGKLRSDIDSFIALCVQAAHRMYERGYIIESENSKKEVQDLYLASDTVKSFILDCCETGMEYKYQRDELYSMYEMYCNREGRQSLSRQGFYGNLRDKGYSERTIDGYKWFYGLRFVADHRS